MKEFKIGQIVYFVKDDFVYRGVVLSGDIVDGGFMLNVYAYSTETTDNEKTMKVSNYQVFESFEKAQKARDDLVLVSWKFKNLILKEKE